MMSQPTNRLNFTELGTYEWGIGCQQLSKLTNRTPKFVWVELKGKPKRAAHVH